MATAFLAAGDAASAIWTATLTGPAGGQLQYKSTLGDWDRVEKGARAAWRSRTAARR